MIAANADRPMTARSELFDNAPGLVRSAPQLPLFLSGAFMRGLVDVEVRSGLLRGLQGLVEERVKPNRLILQVEMLGRAVSLEVDASLLDRVE